jgi:hypothetical protein
MLGNGDGTFGKPAPYPAGGIPVAIGAADMNGDGIADIVVANYGSSTVSVLAGRGDGTFQPAVSMPSIVSSPNFLSIADLNGDGLPDSVVDGTVVFLNQGGLKFSTSMLTACTGGLECNDTSGSTIADYNGDGIPDLAVSSALANVIEVFQGNGDGTFQPAVLYGVSGVSQPVSGNFFGHALPDIAAGANGIAVLENIRSRAQASPALP